MAFFASSKYSRGLTRTSAPVGQFSWQEKAARFAPFGLSGVFSQRLHLTASRFSVSVTAGGIFGCARLNHDLSLPPIPDAAARTGLRGIIVMALYGHCVAQSPQPMQVFGLMSICPSEKRPIAPVGQPVKHSGSWQCRQTDGASTC